MPKRGLVLGFAFVGATANVGASPDLKTTEPSDPEGGVARTSAMCTPKNLGYKWYPTSGCEAVIPYYFGPGLAGCSDGPCLAMRSAIQNAVNQFNLVSAADLGSAFSIYYAGQVSDLPGFGIVFTYGEMDGGIITCESAAPPTDMNVACSGEELGYTVFLGYTSVVATDRGFREPKAAELVCIDLNPTVAWGATTFDRASVVMHELAHALGVKHSDGDSGCMMYDDASCPFVFDSPDFSVIGSLLCLYGDPYWLGCTPSWGWTQRVHGGNSLVVGVGHCDCSVDCTGRSRADDGGTLASGSRSFELAIRDGEETSFEVFATLVDADFAGGEYEHTFDQSYTSAVTRMRIYDGASLIHESEANLPIDIVAPLDVAPTTDPATRMIIETRPNPAPANVSITFETRTASPVRLAILDVGGRVVRTLARSMFSAGRHEVSWDGRDRHGRSVAPGTYFVRLDGEDGVATHRFTMLP